MSLLLGLQQVIVAPPANYDWPNPDEFEHPIELLTWLEPTKLNLLGQDAMVVGKNLDLIPDEELPSPDTWLTNSLQSTLQPFLLSNTDWPVPEELALFDPEQQQNFLTNLLAIIQSPFFNTDWPIPFEEPPSDFDFPQNLLANLLSVVAANPFFAQEWPNPEELLSLLDVDVSQNFITTLLSIVQNPFFNTEWAVPEDLPSFEIDLPPNLLNSLYAITANPFIPYEWTNPDEFPYELEEFIQSRINLIGQDQFFGAPGQPPQNYDWPNPEEFIAIIDLHTWNVSLLQSTLKPAPPIQLGPDIILVNGKLAKRLHGIIYVWLN